MTNTVRISDVIDYFTWRIEELTKKADASRAEYEEARVKYEKGLRFRLFKTPFQDTDTGRLWGMFEARWDFVSYDEWVKEAEGILRELRYHQKLGQDMAAWGWKGWRQTRFYKWAEENNRPC